MATQKQQTQSPNQTQKPDQQTGFNRTSQDQQGKDLNKASKSTTAEEDQDFESDDE